MTNHSPEQWRYIGTCQDCGKPTYEKYDNLGGLGEYRSTCTCPKDFNWPAFDLEEGDEEENEGNGDTDSGNDDTSDSDI